MRIRFAFIVLIHLGLSSSRADSAGDWMVQLKLDGQPIEGMPLAWSHQQVHLLARDGRLWTFAPDAAKEFRKSADRFRSYPASEFRAVLLRELGQGYEVSGTGHYLVAHPAGQRDLWAQRFEDLYRSFVHYFSVRGFKLNEPRFPLVGVVCRDQQEFLHYSAAQGAQVGASILGWYSSESNRLLLYNVNSGFKEGDYWGETLATLIHEATHQTAFNSGLHSRYTPPPVWVIEGIATLFEAPGVSNSRFHTNQIDRINRGRLRHFQQLAPKHRPELIRDLVVSDRLFRLSPTLAYAEAWALTFYLVETEPRKYANYLARTASHAPFQEVAAEERLADFAAVFGDDWPMLEAKFLRFMGGLK
ncbi:MAG: DUF1570 domain-containing protein [Pirellulales bacterium]|nr:DUF1570 domain-containing protein [Pirellulales bacterium]